MSHAGRYTAYSGHRSGAPSAVKWLLISNISIFVLYFLAHNWGFGGGFFSWFALRPRSVVQSFAIWQLVTHMFLHSPLGFFHILFNMLGLWFFGRALEDAWGSKRFLQFYLICGVGTGIVIVIIAALTGMMDIQALGASGAIYGVLAAFAVLWPNQQVIFFIFPLKAKHLVLIFAAISFLSSLASRGTEISAIGHLTGMAIGYLYVKSRYSRVDLFATIEHRYREWKLQRAKKKFQVYLRKQHKPGGNRTVN
jgi:membrane associated rhomboid family serine protease